MSGEFWAFLGVVATATASIIINISNNNKSRQKLENERALRDQKIDSALEGIKERLDEHNNYAQKIGDMRDSMLILQQDVTYLKEKRFK